MIKTVLIFLNPKVSKIPIAAIAIVRQSVMVSLPIVKQIETISATEAMFTASKNEENSFELRNNFTSGLNTATNTKDGRNTAKVEITAPEIPLI